MGTISLALTDIDRSEYIGGGDQGDLLSIAPYGCYRRLILGKRERMEQDLSGNHNVRRGLKLEAVAAETYTELTGRKLRNHTRFVVEESRLGVGMDRHIVAFDERGPGVLEIKCPSAFVFKRYKREGLPADHSAQLNFYMGIKGWVWGSFAIYSAELDELLHFDVTFDAEVFNAQKRKAEEAWKLVEFGPLPLLLEPDSKACGRCQYFAERCHPDELPTPDSGELVHISTPALASAIADYLAASEVIAEAEALKEVAKAEIKVLIGDATAVDAPEGRIYHRSSVRNGVDTKKLKKDYPDAAAACATQTTVRTLRIYERNQ